MFAQNKIESLQLSLKSLELYEDKIDGIIGPNTIAAIKKLEALVHEQPSIEKPISGDSAEKPDVINTLTDGQGADIEDALIFTLKNEGGYSEHPDDKGGATNKGITIGTLSTYLGRKDVSKDEVKNLSYETIKMIYKRYYWDALNLDAVQDQSIATALFDIGIVCGTGTAIGFCQEILGLPQTRKMDTATLNKINSTTDEELIPPFAERTISYFDAIVAKKPSQAVFLKGWKNRANRLLSLIDKDDFEAIVPVSVDGIIGEGLQQLAKQAGVPQADIDKMIDWQTQNKPLSNPRYWVVFKIHEHSKNKRMHIFDRVANTVQSIHAVHGTGSDPNNDGLATEFSNIPESHQSSLGLYKTLGTYTMAKHGRALRLDGLEDTNNNALKRGIVFHGVPYAGDEYVKQNGRCGRSFGCPAVEYALVQDLIDKIKGGSLLLIS
ncbi:UNVERIFIED_ORG: lysozyme family protein [Buttiauxella agrestis ATCC 33320]|jgi:lysozyme family protein